MKPLRLRIGSKLYDQQVSLLRRGEDTERHRKEGDVKIEMHQVKQFEGLTATTRSWDRERERKSRGMVPSLPMASRRY